MHRLPNSLPLGVPLPALWARENWAVSFLFVGRKRQEFLIRFSFPSQFDIIFQEITRLSFKVCIKDSQGMSKSHDPVTVDYAIVGGTCSYICLFFKKGQYRIDCLIIWVNRCSSVSLF